MKKIFKPLCIAAIAALASCNAMHIDREDCPYGLYVTFKYDYNLQRADMFNDHVGEVTLYIFDESGNFVMSQTEANTATSQPLASPTYMMHVSDSRLKTGENYQFLAVASQNTYEEQLASNRAIFRRIAEPGIDVTDLTAMEILLDRQLIGTHTSGKLVHQVVHNDLPLDTLWHGMDLKGITYSAINAVYDTISLVRDTKKINITMRDIDSAEDVDIDNYDLQIMDSNTHILYDNSLNEDHYVIYTPHSTWNTTDRTATSTDDDESSPASAPSRTDVYGKIAHADFMTSRLMYHDDAADDAVLSITYKESGEEIVTLDLPDLLSRLANSDELQRYSPQEFLDRGYDYNLTFYLTGNKLQSVVINVLSWSKRIQYEVLGQD